MIRPAPVEPDRAGGWTLGEIAQELQELRSAAGHPSYTEIARRIARLRAERGLPPAEQRPARATIYDCFRTDRRRVNIDLVVDIVRALGAGEAETARWARACRVAQRQADAATVVTVHPGLPVEEDHFVGRVAELDRILAPSGEAAGPRVYAIQGMPGAGKSRLAVRAAHRLVSQGRVTGAIHADLRGYHPDQPPADPAAVVEALLRILDVGAGQLPSGLERRRVLLAELLRERSHVIVLDDAAGADQVRPLLVDAPGSVLLITSRVSLSELPTAQPVPLGVFSVDEALDVLRRVLGAEPVDADPAAATALVEAAGCQPLAVHLTARRVAARPDWSLADHVEPLLTRLRAGRLDDAVQATLGLSYAALSPQARRLLRLLASQPCVDLDARAAAALAGAEPEQARQWLDELSSHHLVTQPRRHRYALHALVRAYAHDRSLDDDRPAERDAAIVRLCDHLVVMVWTAYVSARPATPTRNREVPAGVEVLELSASDALAWLEASVPSLVTMAGYAAASHRPQVVNDLSDGVAWWLNRYGRYQAARVLHQLAVDTAVASGSRVGQARARLDLGMILIRMGDLDTAIGHVTAAAELFDAEDDMYGAASATNALAIIDVHQGRLDRAAERFHRSAEYARAAGHLNGTVAALDNVAIVHRRAGRLDEAVRYHRLALREAEAIGDRHLEGNSTTNLSEVLLLLGEPEQALATARRALEIGHELDSQPLIAYSSDNVGNAVAATGRSEEAQGYFEDALRRSREIGDRHLEASVLNNLGANLLRLGEAKQALDYHGDAHRLAVEAGEAFEQARALEGLGAVHAEQRDYDEARRCWTEALAAFEQLGSPEAAQTRQRLAGLPPG